MTVHEPASNVIIKGLLEPHLKQKRWFFQHGGDYVRTPKQTCSYLLAKIMYSYITTELFKPIKQISFFSTI
jgi:hypothetical protein